MIFTTGNKHGKMNGKKLKTFYWAGFVIAEIAMIGWAFVWPLVVDDYPGSSVLHIGCLVTLLLFLATLTGLLIERVRGQTQQQTHSPH